MTSLTCNEQYNKNQMNKQINEDSTRIFHKKSGTTPKGKEYENLLTALVAFQLAKNDQVENFQLSSNNSKFGSLDDIVLEVTYKNQISSIYAVQLKHKQNEEKTVTKEKLAGVQGDFSLQKYFGSFKKIKTKNLHCVLYTCAKFKPSDGFGFTLEDKKYIKIKAQKYKLPLQDFLNTSECDYVYQFVVNQDVTTSGEEVREIDEYNEFLKNFYFYPYQKNFDKMKSFASQSFKEAYFCDENAFKKYIEFISSWSELEGKKNCLNKETIKFKIAEILLESCIIPSNSAWSPKFLLLKEACLQYDVILVVTDESDMREKVATLFNQNFKRDIKEVSQIGKQFGFLSKELGPVEQLEKKKVSMIFWHMNIVPLIVHVEEANKKMITRAIELCKSENITKRKFVLFGEGIRREEFRDVKIFHNLNDLSSDSIIYKKIVQNNEISLQGRAPVTLLTIIEENKEMKKIITTVELMKIFDGTYRVGEDKEQLPNPYIEQFLPKIVIGFNFINELRVPSLSIISCNGRLETMKKQFRDVEIITLEAALKEDREELELEESVKFSENNCLDNVNKKKQVLKSKRKKQFEQSQNKVLVMVEGQCSNKEFRRICDKYPNKVCHHFRINSNENLEWIMSNGTIEELKKYRLAADCFHESELFSSVLNKINVVCARPGTGKTVLLKYLKNQIPSNYWIIQVDFREHVLFFEQDHNDSEVLDYFLKFQAKKNGYGDFAAAVRHIFRAKLNVVFLWDGLDELSNLSLKTAMNGIKSISNLGFISWVTARESLQSVIEEQFNLFSLTISEMEREQQNTYIKNRLKSKHNEKEIEVIAKKIIAIIDGPRELPFLGIPLHINILTELFLQDAAKYTKLLNNQLILPDVMAYSVEEKFNVCYKEKCGYEEAKPVLKKILKHYREHRIVQYESVALRTFIPNKNFCNLCIDCDKFLTDIKMEKDDFGIITEVNGDTKTAIFAHNIYGEYFVASWMVKNLKHVASFKNFLFTEAYNSIRIIFDLMLAKNCPAHLAVLCKNISDLRKHRIKISLKDEAGRNPLHLAASWCQKRPILNVEKNEDVYVIDDKTDYFTEEDGPEDKKILNFLITKAKCNPSEKDDLFQWSSIEYADNTLSLLPVEIILSNHKVDFETLQNFKDICNLLFYGIKFDYKKILENIEVIPDMKIKESANNLLHMATFYGRNEFLEKILEIDTNVRKINEKNCEKQLLQHSYDPASPNTFVIKISPSILPKMVNILRERKNKTVSLYQVFRQTPLHVASINGNHEAINMLLERNADINIQNNYGHSALHLAIIHKHLQIVKLLIANGALKDQTNDIGENALHIAVKTGNLELIKYILKQNINLEEQKSKVSPADYAVIMDRSDILELILRRKKITPHLCKSFIFAACNGKQKIIKCLIKKGMKVNSFAGAKKMTALHYAATIGHTAVVKTLIDNKAKVDVYDIDNITPLLMAAANGRLEIVKLLIQKGANVNKTDPSGASPLMVSLSTGQEEVYKFLIKNREKYKVDIDMCNNKGQNPLLYAVDIEDEEILTLLVENKSNVNVKNQDGFGGLYAASLIGSTEIAKLLMEHGADVNIVCNRGRTPLHAAASAGHREIAEILIQNGADVNAVDVEERTGLHFAAANGHYGVAKTLIKNKANITCCDTCGFTPLCMAASNNHLNMVELLLREGAYAARNDQKGIGTILISMANETRGNLRIFNQNLIHIKGKISKYMPLFNRYF